MILKNKLLRKYILKIAVTLIDMETAIVKYFDTYKDNAEKAAEEMFVDPTFSGYLISKDILNRMINYVEDVLGRPLLDVYNNEMFENVYHTVTGTAIELPKGLNLHNVSENVKNVDNIIDNLYKVVNFEILKETYLKMLRNKDKYLKDVQRKKDQEMMSRAQWVKWASMKYNVLKLYLNSFDSRFEAH